MQDSAHPTPGTAANTMVLAIDRTELMPLAEAQPSLAAFVNLLQLGDQFAVLGYRAFVSHLYPDGGLATYDQRSVLDDATTALIATTTGGTTSNLFAVVSAGDKLLTRVAPPKAMVLVASSPPTMYSDGPDDVPNFPIETIALGDHGQQSVLRDIAMETGGSYNFVADPTGLIAVMIELVEQLGIAQILTTGSRTVANQGSYNLVGRVPADTATATFLVFWGNLAITYGAGSGPQWVTTELVDPNGKTNTTPPAWAGDGFAVFSIPQPLAGSWSLKSTYVGTGSCTFTNAVLSRALAP